MTAVRLLALSLLLAVPCPPRTLRAEETPKLVPDTRGLDPAVPRPTGPLSQLVAQAAVSDATRQPDSHALPSPGSAATATRLGPAEALTFEAVLAPAVSVTVFAPGSGTVARVCVQPGQAVAAGDTLARLEEEMLRLRHDLAVMHRDELATRLARVRALEARGMISEYERERFAHEAALAQIAYQEAALDLSRAVLTAPVAGVVARVQVEAGAHVGSGQACFLVVDPTELEAQLPIPVDQLRRVRRGQPVLATAGPAPPLSGRIARLAPVVDPDTGCCLAVARFAAAGPAVLPGTVVHVTVGAQ